MQAASRTEDATNIESIFQNARTDLDRVEQVLIDSLHSDVPLISLVGKHVFQSGGKRMRPLLTILASRLCGYAGSAHIRMAAVVELIHTATLLHDDVVDHAELRRGTRTVNDLWSNETSILVGDFLFTRSFCMMVENQDMEILNLMAETCRLLAEGEILELSKSGDPLIHERDYLGIVKNKTAVLISAACRMGAVLAQRPDLQESLSQYGMNLGMAFQLVDDILDYAAEEEELGKRIGKDLSEGKVTLPIIRTLNQSGKTVKDKIAGIIRNRSQSPDDLRTILEAIHQFDGLEHSHRMALGYVESAKASLNLLPESSEKLSLLAVADFVAARRK
jgi:octaprenyl-diphosphate synthase